MGQGILIYSDDSKTWGIINHDRDEIRSGQLVQLLIGEHWITTRVEHDGETYYVTTPGLKLQNGLFARRVK